MTRTVVCAGQPIGRGPELPSCSCGFDSRHPLQQFIDVFQNHMRSNSGIQPETASTSNRASAKAGLTRPQIGRRSPPAGGLAVRLRPRSRGACSPGREWVPRAADASLSAIPSSSSSPLSRPHGAVGRSTAASCPVRLDRNSFTGPFRERAGQCAPLAGSVYLRAGGLAPISALPSLWPRGRAGGLGPVLTTSGRAASIRQPTRNDLSSSPQGPDRSNHRVRSLRT